MLNLIQTNPIISERSHTVMKNLHQTALKYSQIAFISGKIFMWRSTTAYIMNSTSSLVCIALQLFPIMRTRVRPSWSARGD